MSDRYRSSHICARKLRTNLAKNKMAVRKEALYTSGTLYNSHISSLVPQSKTIGQRLQSDSPSFNQQTIQKSTQFRIHLIVVCKLVLLMHYGQRSSHVCARANLQNGGLKGCPPHTSQKKFRARHHDIIQQPRAQYFCVWELQFSLIGSSTLTAPQAGTRRAKVRFTFNLVSTPTKQPSYLALFLYITSQILSFGLLVDSHDSFYPLEPTRGQESQCW